MSLCDVLACNSWASWASFNQSKPTNQRRPEAAKRYRRLWLPLFLLCCSRFTVTFQTVLMSPAAINKAKPVPWLIQTSPAARAQLLWNLFGSTQKHLLCSTFNLRDLDWAFHQHDTGSRGRIGFAMTGGHMASDSHPVWGCNNSLISNFFPPKFGYQSIILSVSFNKKTG